MPRKLFGHVHIHGVDHEIFGPNEPVDLTFPINLILFENQPAEILLNIPDVRLGGECRVETRVGATLLDNGSILIKGEVRLFEGDSEGTNEPEEGEPISFIVTRNTQGNPNPTTFFTELRNETVFGDDYAHVKFTLSNVIVEPD